MSRATGPQVIYHLAFHRLNDWIIGIWRERKIFILCSPNVLKELDAYINNFLSFDSPTTYVTKLTNPHVPLLPHDSRTNLTTSSFPRFTTSLQLMTHKPYPLIPLQRDNSQEFTPSCQIVGYANSFIAQC